MVTLRKVGAAALLLTFFYANAGCMRFTERDYELQKKAYEKQRQQQELQDKERVRIRW